MAKKTIAAKVGLHARFSQSLVILPTSSLDRIKIGAVISVLMSTQKYAWLRRFRLTIWSAMTGIFCMLPRIEGRPDLMTGMLMTIQNMTSTSQGSAAFQSGILPFRSSFAVSIAAGPATSSGRPRIFLMRKRTATVTRPEKTPTRPIAAAGRICTKRIAQSPSVRPATSAVKNPFFTPAMPSATQSMASAMPVEITGRNHATVIPSALTSSPKTEAGSVIGTARSENEVSGSYPRQGRATAAMGENPSASMIGGSIVTGVAPMETRNVPKPTFNIMICSYRSAATVLMYAVMLLIAPVTSIIVTCRMEKSTISEIPNDESTPSQDAASATLALVWKKNTAMITVNTHPTTPISVPDCRKRTSPI